MQDDIFDDEDEGLSKLDHPVMQGDDVMDEDPESLDELADEEDDEEDEPYDDVNPI